MKLEQSKKENEMIRKSEKLESNLTIIMKKLSKLKIIIKEFKRNINMEVNFKVTQWKKEERKLLI